MPWVAEVQDNLAHVLPLVSLKAGQVVLHWDRVVVCRLEHMHT